ncbi:MAG: hypothetical protein LQ341_005198 [Variospora aurantia]|nr:MAG: hypothetical protein LQ341_005198 [Variospora aurantia]
MPVNQSTEIDPHIEAVMVDGVKLDGIASKLKDQASKARSIARDHGSDELSRSLEQSTATPTRLGSQILKDIRIKSDQKSDSRPGDSSSSP